MVWCCCKCSLKNRNQIVSAAKENSPETFQARYTSSNIVGGIKLVVIDNSELTINNYKADLDTGRLFCFRLTSSRRCSVCLIVGGRQFASRIQHSQTHSYACLRDSQVAATNHTIIPAVMKFACVCHPSCPVATSNEGTIVRSSPIAAPTVRMIFIAASLQRDVASAVWHSRQ